MIEGVKRYPQLALLIGFTSHEISETDRGRLDVELAAAERTALDYDRIDALRLAAEKEVDVLAGELGAARKRLNDALAICKHNSHLSWKETISAIRQALDGGQS